MSKLINLIKSHILLIIFLAIYLLFGVLTYKYYPIANGEEYRYLRGQETLEHFLHGQFTEKLIQPLPNYFLYNLYPMALVWLNPKFYYEWFHLMNFTFASLGFIAVYFIALRLTASKKAAVFSMFALLLFPGFFGQLSLNPIDMPFMVFYLLLLWALLSFSAKEAGHWSTLLLALLFGITEGLRQLGLTLYIVMVALDIYDYYFSDSKNKINIVKFAKERLLKYIFIFLIANFFMMITWPNFAVNYFKSYYWFLIIGSNFYLWDYGLLFFGKLLTNQERPWFYLPFLQMITYPLYISLLFLSSIIFFKRYFKNRTYFIITFTFVFNYLLYLLLHPVVYDGIRHFLFFIPLITLLAISNLLAILNSIKTPLYKYILVAVISLNLGFIATFMYKNFPYIYPYFNVVAYAYGNPYKLFESDYSNTKYKEASEWLRDVYIKENYKYNVSYPGLMLKVYPCDNGYAVDYYSYKKFLTVIDKEKSDLIICDYRNLKQRSYEGDVIKTFYLNGHDILNIIRPSKK